MSQFCVLPCADRFLEPLGESYRLRRRRGRITSPKTKNRLKRPEYGFPVDQNKPLGAWRHPCLQKLTVEKDHIKITVGASTLKSNLVSSLQLGAEAPKENAELGYNAEGV